MSSQGQEFAFIDWIRRSCPALPAVVAGIGDDAAVLRTGGSADLLVTVDMLMEGVHFIIPPATPQLVGRKALAVNLSDIAAMAGKPTAAFISVALPRNREIDFAEEVYAGLLELADDFGVAIAGGDTNSWDGPFVVSVTLLGETTGSGAVRRNGARPGDWIMATGSFGGSLRGKHLDFHPRVAEARRLHELADLHAMIDVSDGLSADLYHILDESCVAAVLLEDAVPISDAARSIHDGKTPLEHALGDGEDFELLFTVSPDDGRKLLDGPPFATPLSHIGEIVPGTEGMLRNVGGHLLPLPRQGWVH